LPGKGPAAAELRAFIQAYDVDHVILRSHAIPKTVALSFMNDDVTKAIHEREDIISNFVDALGDRLAEWGRVDRPSVEYLLAQVAE
jgi:hypothetical protein